MWWGFIVEGRLHLFRVNDGEKYTFLCFYFEIRVHFNYVT